MTNKKWLYLLLILIAASIYFFVSTIWGPDESKTTQQAIAQNNIEICNKLPEHRGDGTPRDTCRFQYAVTKGDVSLCWELYQTGAGFCVDEILHHNLGKGASICAENERFVTAVSSRYESATLRESNIAECYNEYAISSQDESKCSLIKDATYRKACTDAFKFGDQ